ncbi:cupin domain-containing protein [Streptomyces sp. NPDC015139]|uniref:cupin domain-containing protein n=1 Tax=Streptomyces sp. NPDC015139 TaxID=3364942 RepID=UPI0036F95A14
MTSPSAFDSGPAESAAAPRVLCDTRALTEAPPVPAGVLWKLAESGRQLDANVVRLAPGGRIDTHTEPSLDVLLLVVSGSGTVDSPEGEPQPVTEGTLLWLPHGSTRAITAGGTGLAYLTVHGRRPGLTIGPRPGTSPVASAGGPDPGDPPA